MLRFSAPRAAPDPWLALCRYALGCFLLYFPPARRAQPAQPICLAPARSLVVQRLAAPYASSFQRERMARRSPGNRCRGGKAQLSYRNPLPSLIHAPNGLGVPSWDAVGRKTLSMGRSQRFPFCGKEAGRRSWVLIPLGELHSAALHCLPHGVLLLSPSDICIRGAVQYQQA
jgi:hypothetical protein